jgi:hypothetical protein
MNPFATLKLILHGLTVVKRREFKTISGFCVHDCQVVQFLADVRFMRRFRRFALIGFIALLVVLPLHEIADPGEQLPFDDEVVAVVFAALFITATLLTCRSCGRELFALLRAAARVRTDPNRTVAPSWVRAIEPPRDQSSAHLVLCQFRV